MNIGWNLAFLKESHNVSTLYNVRPDILLVWEKTTASLSVFSLWNF